MLSVIFAEVYCNVSLSLTGEKVSQEVGVSLSMLEIYFSGPAAGRKKS